MTTIAAITDESVLGAMFVAMIAVMCAWQFLLSKWDRDTPWHETPAGGKTRNPNPYEETFQELAVLLVVQFMLAYGIVAYFS